jgi:tetratricopeptide (TPR) repeat protein
LGFRKTNCNVVQSWLAAAALATLSAVPAFAVETPRLESAVALRQQALQRILRHSQKPEDIDATLSLYKSAIDASEKENGSDSSYTGDLYFERGSYAFDNSRFNIALDNLNKSVQINPSGVTARLRLIQLLELRKESIQARQQIQQLLARHGDCKEGRQLLVLSMQKFDPAAATRQAFNVDKFVKIAITEGAPLQPAQSAAAPHNASAPGEAKPSEAKPTVPVLSSALSLRSPHAKPPEVVQPKPLVAPSAESAAVIEAVTSVQREISKFAKAAPPKESKPVKASNPKPAKSAAAKKAAQHAVAQSMEAPLPKSSKGKSGGKMPSGMVPPPPPTPFAFPMPMMPRPDLSNGGLQLKTEAKIKKTPAPKSESASEKAEAKKAASEKISVPPVPNIPTPHEGASSSGNADSDPDFLLEWGGANKRKKK